MQQVLLQSVLLLVQGTVTYMYIRWKRKVRLSPFCVQVANSHRSMIGYIVRYGIGITCMIPCPHSAVTLHCQLVVKINQLLAVTANSYSSVAKPRTLLHVAK